ncbi:MAG: hypothetical protein LQ340_008094, partial [Diploschistes diacapsis]
MAQTFGYEDAVQFALVVERMTQGERRDCLDRFYAVRRRELAGMARGGGGGGGGGNTGDSGGGDGGGGGDDAAASGAGGGTGLGAVKRERKRDNGDSAGQAVTKAETKREEEGWDEA